MNMIPPLSVAKSVALPATGEEKFTWISTKRPVDWSRKVSMSYLQIGRERQDDAEGGQGEERGDDDAHHHGAFQPETEVVGSGHRLVAEVQLRIAHSREKVQTVGGEKEEDAGDEHAHA